MKGSRQAFASASEQTDRGAHVAHQPAYLVLDEVVRLLRFDATAPLHARQSCRQWLERNAVPVLRRGRVLLVERAVLDGILRG